MDIAVDTGECIAAFSRAVYLAEDAAKSDVAFATEWRTRWCNLWENQIGRMLCFQQVHGTDGSSLVAHLTDEAKGLLSELEQKVQDVRGIGNPL